MRTRLTVFLAAALAAVCCAAPKQQSRDLQMRKPAVAGSFYPADPKELARVVDEAIARAQTPQIAGTLTALVSPHAGYEFSAPVAAYGYSLLKGRSCARCRSRCSRRSRQQLGLHKSARNGGGQSRALATVSSAPLCNFTRATTTRVGGAGRGWRMAPCTMREQSPP